MRTPKEQSRHLGLLVKKDQKRRTKLQAAGIDYDYPELVRFLSAIFVRWEILGSSIPSSIKLASLLVRELKSNSDSVYSVGYVQKAIIPPKSKKITFNDHDD